MQRTAANVVHIPGLDIARAKRYSRIRLTVLVTSTIWSFVYLIWFASDSRAARMRQTIERFVPSSRVASPAFFSIALLFSWLANVPIALLGGFLVERRFGLSKQSGVAWFFDRCRALAAGLIIQVPLLTLSFAVIRRRPRDWWLILSGAAVPLTVVFSNLSPVLLMPLFNRFEPLRDAALAERTRALALRAGVPVSDIFEMDMSRQSEKPNAMFTGLGRTRRIVLGDTLLERFDLDEVEAVVAHELAHQVHGDMWRLMGFGAGASFGLAWLMSRLAPPLVWRTRRFTGVARIGEDASLPLLAALLTAIGVVTMPVQAAFSRSIERRADRLALELTGNGDAYARAMERLASLSLADPDPPRPIVFMLYSHPPIAERIRMARSVCAQVGLPAHKTTNPGRRG